MKRVSSLPANMERGREHASALVVLNSALTGRPEAILEGATVSSQRTAASPPPELRKPPGDTDGS